MSRVSLVLMLAGSALSLGGAASAAALAAKRPAAASCKLGPDDLSANARLTFEAFDQQGTSSATARALGERGCVKEAAAASAHYLVHGPLLNEYQRNVVRWHLGQYLATAGEEREAALVMAGTRRETDPERPDFDWNTYVVGTWAFLTKDRVLLDARYAELRAKPGHSNQINAKVLGRLSRCFRKPYREAVESNACETP